MENPDFTVAPPTVEEEPQPRRHGMIVGILKVVLPIVILFGGGGLALGLITSSPTADQKPPVRQAKLVEVSSALYETARITIDAMGTVTPNREVELRPRVGGQVIWMSDEYMPGGILTQGDRLLKIDPKDYQLLVRQATADLEKAESDLKIERGEQTVAKREFELLGQEVRAEERNLILRQPQLIQAEADVETAQAVLDQAKLDLARTEVTAPFNAVIESRDANLGTQVTTSTALATLIGTDSYLIEVAVPVNKLQWIEIPRKSGEQGARVRIFNEAAWGRETYRTGHVVRLASSLESEGRMAQLLVKVEDPLALGEEKAGRPVLLIESYVRVEIEGKEVGPVASVDRKLLRDGDSVWVMTPDDKLEIRPVDILYRGQENVLVQSGLQPDDRIVTTALSAAVEGMSLRLRNESSSPATAGRTGAGR